MYKKTTKTILILTIISFLSFNINEIIDYEFKHPKKKKVTLALKAENLGEFTKQKRGGDFYYSNLNNLGSNNINCSVLFYKLNDDEVVQLVDMPKIMIGGPDSSPAYPLAYFSNYSKLKPFESNNSQWGEPDKNFMYRQADITEYQGQKINQKHMYGYSMIDKNVFINIHLSKTNCTINDSIYMRKILGDFKLVK